MNKRTLIVFVLSCLAFCSLSTTPEASPQRGGERAWGRGGSWWWTQSDRGWWGRRGEERGRRGRPGWRDRDGGREGGIGAPEVDPNLFAAGALLLVGGSLVVLGRKRRPAEIS